MAPKSNMDWCKAFALPEWPQQSCSLWRSCIKVIHEWRLATTIDAPNGPTALRIVRRWHSESKALAMWTLHPLKMKPQVRAPRFACPFCWPWRCLLYSRFMDVHGELCKCSTMLPAWIYLVPSFRQMWFVSRRPRGLCSSKRSSLPWVHHVSKAQLQSELCETWEIWSERKWQWLFRFGNCSWDRWVG